MKRIGDVIMARYGVFRHSTYRLPLYWTGSGVPEVAVEDGLLRINGQYPLREEDGALLAGGGVAITNFHPVRFADLRWNRGCCGEACGSWAGAVVQPDGSIVLPASVPDDVPRDPGETVRFVAAGGAGRRNEAVRL